MVPAESITIVTPNGHPATVSMETAKVVLDRYLHALIANVYEQCTCCYYFGVLCTAGRMLFTY